MLDILRFLICGGALLLASYTDLRSRYVYTIIWLVTGIIGLILLAVEIPIEAYLMIGATACFFIESFVPVYLEDEHSIKFSVILYLIGFVFFILFILYISPELLWMLIIPVMIVLARAFNRFKILRGGADAKAMMCIAILIPQYPHIFGYPIISLGEMETIMRVTFPFVFEVLFYAGLTALCNPLLLLFKNTFRKDFGFPEMFLGYKMNIKDIEKKHVWLMEVIRDNEHVLMVFPKDLDLEKELEELKRDGTKKVWVQPKIPFVIFITIGFFLSYIIGNFLFVFMI